MVRGARVSDDLHGTLADVSSRILQYQGKGIGEQNTKNSLISPVLHALGWNMVDLEEVQLEYKRKAMDNPVDYALSINREPSLFVEAKALDGNIDDPRWAGQIMGYAAVAGVEWIVLTNGNDYRIYNSHANVPVERKLFRSLRVTDDEAEAAETLSLLSKQRLQEKLIDRLWRAHFIDRQVREAFDALLEPEPSVDLVRLIRKRVPDLPPGDIKAGLARLEVRFDFPGPVVAPPAPAPKQPESALAQEKGAKAPWHGVTLTDLLGTGLLKPPVELTKTYKKRALSARLEADGQITFGGARYASLSTAAGRARRSVLGPDPGGRPYPQTNGWTFWQYQNADGRWRDLDELRRLYHEAHTGRS